MPFTVSFAIESFKYLGNPYIFVLIKIANDQCSSINRNKVIEQNVRSFDLVTQIKIQQPKLGTMKLKDDMKGAGMSTHIREKKTVKNCESFQLVIQSNRVIQLIIERTWVEICTAYFSDARALLKERVIVLWVYATHACSFNCWMDYSWNDSHFLTIFFSRVCAHT